MQPKKLLITVLLTLLISGIQAQKIRIQGSVRDIDGVPLVGVNIVQGGFRVTMTDEDGKFSANVHPNRPLKFSMTEYEDLEVEIKGRQVIEIEMRKKMIQIEEVVIVQKAKLKKVAFDPTDIEVIGNYLHLKTRFKVPQTKFKNDTRLVVQPIMHEVLSKKNNMMLPVVIDGHHYSITQARMYNFDMTRDPLYPYIIENKITSANNIVTYHDSLYVKKTTGNYLANVKLSIEDYNKQVLWDSIIIAQGTVNPMRFFEYKIDQMEITDTAYIPKPELKLYNECGVSRIIFKVNTASVDDKDPKNLSEFDKIHNRLSGILKDTLLTLKSIKVEGISSPEGPFEKNNRLASSRSKVVLDRITAAIPKDMRSFVKVSYSSRVESWSTVAEIMEKDSCSDASRIRKIVAQNPYSPDKQSSSIYKLESYRKLINPRYLPNLRRVEYSIEYSEFRPMNDDEIRRQYALDSKRLSRYDFYRLFTTTSCDSLKEGYLRESLRRYPAFTLAANKLAVMLLAKNVVDTTILNPFIRVTAPKEILINQTLMLLSDNDYAGAQNLLYVMPALKELNYLKAIVSALNGDYQSAYDEITARGGLNEVLLLLAMKQNNLAFEKVKALNQENSKVLYIRAVCANRLDDLTDAMIAMKKALVLDASLKNIARTDSDVSDLLEIIGNAN